MNPALRTDARLLRLLSPEAMPAQPRADWRVRGSRPYAPSLLPCLYLFLSAHPACCLVCI